jgi:hypothetical protein
MHGRERAFIATIGVGDTAVSQYNFAITLATGEREIS